MIKNVLIYISDSLRWDYGYKILKDNLRSYYPIFKTVAQSVITPTSLASILTGLNPPRHGVFCFFDRISPILPTFFDLFPNISLYLDNPHDVIYKVFNDPPRNDLVTLLEPFIYVELSALTHMPYDKTYGEDAISYLKERGSNISQIRNEYKNCVMRSYERFLQLVKVLKKRGIKDSTLIIFTSDHGEFLGEYGFVGHTFPALPEAVYVPTVIISPLTEGRAYFKHGIIRQVDILPTAIAILNLNVLPWWEGVNILEESSQHLLGFNYTVIGREKISNIGKKLEFLTNLDVWKDIISSAIYSENGYYINLHCSFPLYLALLLYELFFRPKRKLPLKPSFKALTYCRRKIKYKVDKFSEEFWEKALNYFEQNPTFGFMNNLKVGTDIITRSLGKAKLRKKVKRLKYFKLKSNEVRNSQ